MRVSSRREEAGEEQVAVAVELRVLFGGELHECAFLGRWVEDVGEPRAQVLAGAPAVVIDESGGAVGVAARDGVGDRLVLVPQRLALARLLQHRAHHAAQVAPVQAARSAPISGLPEAA